MLDDWMSLTTDVLYICHISLLMNSEETPSSTTPILNKFLPSYLDSVI